MELTLIQKKREKGRLATIIIPEMSVRTTAHRAGSSTTLTVAGDGISLEEKRRKRAERGKSK